MTTHCLSEKTTATIDATTTEESASSTCQTSEGIPDALDRMIESVEYLGAWAGLGICAAVFLAAAFYRTGKVK